MVSQVARLSKQLQEAKQLQNQVCIARWMKKGPRFVVLVTLPETNIAPENGWLEY